MIHRIQSACLMLSILLIVPALMACEDRSAPLARTPIATKAASAADFQALLDARGAVTFRSFRDTWHGTDNDTEYIFLPDGRLWMIDYGYVIRGYEKQYSIAADGTITIAGSPNEFISDRIVTLRYHNQSLLLFEQGAYPAYGVTPPGHEKWPFGLIPAEEEMHTPRKVEWIRDQEKMIAEHLARKAQSQPSQTQPGERE